MAQLIIDSSSDTTLLVIREQAKPPRVCYISKSESDRGELAAVIRGLLSDISSLMSIGVGRGPGSYTGTRAGMAMAQGLSMGLQVPLFCFPSLLCFFPEHPEESIGVRLLGKSGRTSILIANRKTQQIVVEGTVLEEEASRLLSSIPHVTTLPILPNGYALAEFLDLALHADKIEPRIVYF